MNGSTHSLFCKKKIVKRIIFRNYFPKPKILNAEAIMARFNKLTENMEKFLVLDYCTFARVGGVGEGGRGEEWFQKNTGYQ